MVGIRGGDASGIPHNVNSGGGRLRREDGRAVGVAPPAVMHFDEDRLLDLHSKLAVDIGSVTVNLRQGQIRRLQTDDPVEEVPVAGVKADVDGIDVQFIPFRVAVGGEKETHPGVARFGIGSQPDKALHGRISQSLNPPISC